MVFVQCIDPCERTGGLDVCFVGREERISTEATGFRPNIPLLSMDLQVTPGASHIDRWQQRLSLLH